MGQRSVQKGYVQSLGINSDGNPAAFPEGHTLDESNFFLDIDGSRRRRRGLRQIPSSQRGSLTDLLASSAHGMFPWRNANGNPINDFLIVRAGYWLVVYPESFGASLPPVNSRIDLRLHAVAGTADSDVASGLIDISYGRGHAFVVGQNIEPFYIEYDEVGAALLTAPITIIQRDFEGIDDGLAIHTRPTVLTDEHSYNLQNRGWTSGDIGDFFTAEAVYPAKNMLYRLGFQRDPGAGTINADDGVKAFSPAKMAAELFGDVDAPQGHFRLSPFDTTTFIVTDFSNQLPITTWSISGTTPGAQTITVTTDAVHGLAPSDDVQITGQSATFRIDLGAGSQIRYVYHTFQFNGTHAVVTTPTTTTFTIGVTFPSGFDAWVNQFDQLGTVSTETSGTFVVPGGYTTDFRPEAVAFHAGRVWYAGTRHAALADKIFFSQTVESPEFYGKCYQQADPTSPFISDLVDTDGGSVRIPDMGSVKKMVSLRNSLLVFTSNGIWEIHPGDLGFFAATSYGVRKLSSVRVASGEGVVVAEDIPHFLGETDAYRIVFDADTRNLVVQNLTEGRIHKLYNDSSGGVYGNQFRLELSPGAYDQVSKRIHWLIHVQTNDTPPGPYDFNRALILDLRLGAWTKYDVFAKGVYARPTTTSGAMDPSLVLLYPGNVSESVRLMAYTALDFKDGGDIDGVGASDAPGYIEAGHEVTTGPGHYKTAPVVHTFHRRAEKTYEVLSGVPVIYYPGSLKIQAKWDWTDNSIAGKFGTARETYRPRRQFTPDLTVLTETEFDDGVPVFATRNKLRGRGRSVRFRFTTTSGMGADLLGWMVRYDSNTEA